MGAVRHLLLRFRNAASNSRFLFSTSAAAICRPWTHHHSSQSEEEIHVYRRALKLQRPTLVSPPDIQHRYNRVSFIGTIDYPLKTFNCENFGAYTFLNVKASNGRYRDFRVFLIFWGEMGETSVQFLKPDDLIYVSGRLESSTKTNTVGKPEFRYKVNVEDVNFVVLHKGNSLMKRESKLSPEEIKQKRRDRLHLWQILFASPDEWWDNRNDERFPNGPHFKHKDTGETLWLRGTDPPWVQQQLHLLNSRLGKRTSGGVRNARLNLSPLFYDDPEGT